MAKNGGISSQAKQARDAQDEDLAIKQFNPLLDYALGGLFLLLCGKLAHICIKDQSAGFIFLGCLVAVIVVINVTSVVSEVIGRQISKLRTYDGIPEESKDPLRKKLGMRKFKAQCWQLLIHGGTTVWEIYLLRDQKDWWDNPTTTFEPCPSTYLGENPENKHSFELRFFYIAQLAIWVWTCFSCQFLESRRKDYIEMMLHHIVTISLVMSSLLQEQLAIGLIVLLVHDATDIFIDLLKLTNYLKLTDAHGFFLVEIAFTMNLVSWFYFRLYKFPMEVIYKGAWLGGTACLPGSGTVMDKCLEHSVFCFGNIGALLILFVLHVFWFFLFLRILQRILAGDASEAGKHEYEGVSGSDCEEKLKSP